MTLSVVSFFAVELLLLSESKLLDDPFTAAFFNALRTALIIPFELNVAPLTESTFVLCFLIINGSKIPFARLK